MIKYIFFFIFLFFASICNAQNFNIQSLDGSIRQINLAHEVGDQKLVISYLADTIVIDNFIAISQNVTILNGCFLEIQYAIRTGSDQSRERILLLCVNKNKLCTALHLRSLVKYDIDRVFDKKADSLRLFDEHGDYDLKVNVTGTSSANYKLYADIHDESTSKQNPATNHNYNKQIILIFDKDRAVFYNAHEDISQYFTIYNPKNQRATKQYLIGTFPVIKLEKINYYYIKGEWYEKGNNDNLLKYAYK